MKRLLSIMALSLTLVACDRPDHPNNPSVQQDNDNTGKNVRDRDFKTKTPMDQSENEVDRTITQKIRQAIIADDALSTNAKNIKIITVDGVVTLRGPVANSQEKENIANKVKNVAGISRVDNQLEITRNNY